ncbi:MAG TPA: ABC transporter permease [Solirubrobacteraceae bacterium]|jgi:simple sugar transport system permease protein|nr:ABC transporter permease [Solirubrobacteraceae bacterium]
MNGLQQALAGGVESGTVILFPALGELIGERAGIVNLGSEGCMLAGALAAYALTAETGSPVLGVFVGAAAGALIGMAHAYLVVRRRADQLASGLVMWFLAVGLTAVLGAAFVSRTATPLEVVKIPLLGSIPGLGPILFDHDPLVYLGYALVPLVWWILFRTRAGLVLRATGERPEVVAVAGRRPELIQIAAVSIGAALAGVGGAQLSVGYVDNWFDDMTNGYGFVAVAVVLFAAWRPLWVLFGSYLFGVALASASVLQAHGVAVNQYLLDALPYLVTIVVLVAVARRGSNQAPEGVTRALTNTS